MSPRNQTRNVPPPSKTAASEEDRSRRTQGAGVTIASRGRKIDLLQEGGAEGARRLLQRFHDQAAAKRPSEGSRQRGSLEVLQHQITRAPLKVRRESGAERMYEEDKTTANELLTWLTKIKAESVLKDLDDTRLKRTSMRRNIRATPGSFPAATWR